MVNAGLAALLSLFLPGLGQLYAGRALRAFLIFMAGVVVVLVLPPAVLLVTLFAVYDAVRIAR